MRDQTVWSALKTSYKNHQVSVAKEDYEQAIKKLCELRADSIKEEMLLKHYEEQTKAIDPWQDHNGFASMRQKYLNTADDLEMAQRKQVRQAEKTNRVAARLEDLLTSQVHRTTTELALES